jgi:hypothetical protein
METATAAAFGNRHGVGFVGDSGGEGFHITEHFAGEALDAGHNGCSES